MLGFLFVDEADFTRRRRRRRRSSTTTGARSSRRPATRWRRSTTWTHRRHRGGPARQLVEELGLKPRNAFGPVRVAVTGRRVSPPLFESLELLGRDARWPGSRGAALSADRGPRTPAAVPQAA